MVREVEKSDYLLTILDIKILNFLSDGKITNMNQIATTKEIDSTPTTIKNNLRKLKHYKLINWVINETPPKPHKISINKNFQTEILGILKIFKDKL